LGKQATIQAVLLASKRSKEQMKFTWAKGKREHVTDALLSQWRRAFREYSWFEPWLLHGEDLPPSVRVVTAQQARRATRAWDYAAFCVDLNGIRPDSTYAMWLSKRQIPNLGCLKWLYGFAPPDGVYMASEALQRLKHEKGRLGILNELKKRGFPDQLIIWRWQGDGRTAGPMNLILAGGKGKDGNGWEQLDPETQRQMIVVEEVVSLDACLSRADLSRSQYYVELQTAERCGVKSELLAYLASEGRYAPPRKKGGSQDQGKRVKNRECGLAAPNFFIPTTNMWRFRKRAEQEATEQNIWEFVNLPGFDAWFLDWTAPKPHRGKRHVVSLGSAPVSPPQVRNERSDAAAALNSAQSRKSRGGRPQSPETQKLYRFCWEARRSGEKRVVTMRRANAHFGRTVIREESHVTTFAKRYRPPA
jgi:hypothetical protein